MSADAAAARERWIQLLLIPALFYAGAKLSLLFAVTPQVVVLLWLPNGLLLAAFFHFGRRRALAFAIAILLAEIAADAGSFTLAQSALFGAVNLLEASLACLVLRRSGFDPRFLTPVDLAKFVAAAPGLASFAAALGGAAIHQLYGAGQIGYFELARTWWFSDGLGLLIVTPLLLSYWPVRPTPDLEGTPLRWYDGAAVAGSLGIAVAFALAQDRMLGGFTVRAFLLIVPAAYVAARFGPRTTTLAMFAIALLVLCVAKLGHRPFGDIPLRETAISAQELIAVTSLLSLSIATLLSQYRRAARHLEAQVRERTESLIALNHRLLELAVTDPLTGTLNRRALFELLHVAFESERRYRRGLALVLFDLDHFKEVNDRYGHAIGDAALQHVVAVVKGLCRASDALARYGGEEFVLVAPEIDAEGALALAGRIRDSLAGTDLSLRHHRLRVTASFGVATVRPDDEGPEAVLLRADQALYEAKARGRNRVVSEPPPRGRPDIVAG